MSSPILNIEGPNFNTGLGVGQDYVYVPDVAALRGANSIEALTTVGLNLKTLILVVIDGQFQAWRLDSGNADGTDPNNQVQPGDYDDTTNDVHWVNTGSFIEGIIGSHVTTAAAQNIDSGVDTAISFDTQRMNTGEWSAANPTRFVCDQPGVYAIAGCVSFAANASGYRKLFVKKNGGAYITADIQPANGAGATVCKVSTLVYLLTDDYVELIAHQTSGAGLDVQKQPDYSPEFAAIWLGNPVAMARNNDTLSSASEDQTDPPTVTTSIDVTDVGWYRIYEGTAPAVGSFNIRRLSADDGGLVDLDAAFAVVATADVGAIQATKNVMNADLQGMDVIRVSYEGEAAYVDVHLNLAGTWEIVRPNKDGYVTAPYLVTAPGADGDLSLNITPNVIASTDPVDVPQVNSSGLKIASPATDGWVSPTGTQSRTDFDPASVTTEELAKRVTALIIDHLAFGSIREGLPSSMIYTDMLSLANSLVSEDTVVNISDIFEITSAPDTSVQGIYVPAGTANGHTLYRLQGYEWNTATTRCVQFDGGTDWEIYGASGVLYRSNAPLSPAEPWNVTQWEDTVPVNVAVTTVAPNVALTYNVLTDTHTAAYATDSGDGSNSGVYLYTDDFGGKRRYYQVDGPNNRRIEWVVGSLLWTLADDVNGILYFSDEDVTYPDQVTTWQVNVGTGVLSVAQMDAVDLASGITIAGGGSDTDGVYFPELGVTPQYGAYPVYRRTDGTRYLNSDLNSWWITNEAGGFGTTYARSDTAAKFPWETSWITFALIAQQKKVAGPTNWHV